MEEKIENVNIEEIKENVIKQTSFDEEGSFINACKESEEIEIIEEIEEDKEGSEE